LDDLLVNQRVVLLALTRDDMILAPSIAPVIGEIEALVKICGNFLRGEGRADYQKTGCNPELCDAEPSHSFSFLTAISQCESVQAANAPLAP
jgi:hypothetical protein